MTIAARKRRENAVEYVLYVWQMEDLLRGVDFDLHQVRGFLEGGIADEAQAAFELRWMEELAKRMKQEGLESGGHVADVEKVLAELHYVHNALLTVARDPDYTLRYEENKPYIDELMARSGGNARNEVEVCLTGVYGLLMLRLRKAEISPETEEGLNTIAGLLAELARHHRTMKENMNPSMN